MNVVVLGGTGFLGRHICEALENRGVGATVISSRPDHAFLLRYAPRSIAFELGTTAADEVLAKADRILHFGHRSRPASNFGAEVREVNENIQPAIHLFSELARSAPKAHIIYASSGGQVYGPRHTAPIPETAPAQPTTPYAFGKYVIEESLRYFSRSGTLRSTILRIANPVGRWQVGQHHGFVSAAVEAALLNRRLPLFGSGKNARDYFDARDVATFVVKLALDEALPEGTYNIGSGIGLTEEEVLTLVQGTLGVPIAVDRRPARSFDMPYAVLDIRRASADLNWSPSTSLTETIRDLSDAIGSAPP